MEITPRMRSILAQIPRDHYITSDEIARQVHLSEKTVRATIKQLSTLLANSGAEILSKTRRGYTLLVRDENQWNAFLSAVSASRDSDRENPVPATTEGRVEYLFWTLMDQTDYVRVEDLCEILFVSRPTLTSDFKRVEEVLAPYHIAILRRPRYGIHMQGKEMDIRNCMIHRMVYELETDGDSFAGRCERELAQIHEILLENVSRNRLHLSQVVFQDLTISIFVAVRRVQMGRIVPLALEDVRNDVSGETWKIAQTIAEAIEACYSAPSFPPSEIAYIAVNLAGKCNYDTFAGECCQMIPAFVEELAQEMLEVVYETFRLDARKNLTLLMFLSQHLFPMTIRLKYHIFIKNDQKDEIRQKYSFAYALASQAVIPLKLKYHEEISEDEIAYLAVLFALELEQSKELIQKQNILIICAAGMSSARLLAYQYKQEFKDYINEVYYCDMYSIDRMDFDHIDYVFSTVPLEKKLPKPVMEIRTFLNRGDISGVRKALQYETTSVLSNYYSESLFFSNVKGSSKEEVIWELCERIQQVYPLPQNFYQAVLRREELAATDFGNRVALPHPYKAITNDTFVCVAVLEKPIIWVKNEVQVVMLVSISPTEHRQLQTFYKMTTGLMQDIKAIDDLIANPDYINFIRLLCQDRED